MARKQRVAGDVRARRRSRALERLYSAMHLRDVMTKSETRTEAYHAYHKGMITEKQARELGCVINGR